MKLGSHSRSVTLSIREFSEFNNGVQAHSYSPLNTSRAQLGSLYHKKIQDSMPDSQSEVSINATVTHNLWTLHFQGRIDQVITRNNDVILREIKTISTDLPLPQEDLENLYAPYFTQAATYLALAEYANLFPDHSLSSELLFININDDSEQYIPIADTHHFQAQLNHILPFLESRFQSKQSLLSFDIQKPFSSLREGQEEALQNLKDNTAHTILFEAPTGFGKTWTTLHHALQCLKNNRFDRVIYLTSKSTGQLQVTSELKSLLPQNAPIKFLQLRSKEEHAIQSPLHTCALGNCYQHLQEHWSNANIDLNGLFQDNTVTLDTIQLLAAETGICPFAISKALLPLCHIWICDYNYLFSPQHKSVLSNTWDFDPKSTLLIVDESHNLPSRIAQNYSHALYFNSIQHTYECILDSDSPSSTKLGLSHLASLLKPTRPSAEHSADIYQSLSDALHVTLENTDLPYQSLPQEAIDSLHELYYLSKTLNNHDLPLLIWSEKKHQLLISCLDASQQIHETLKPFSQALLMSATLEPISLYQQSIGATQSSSIKAESPWRDSAYTVEVDSDVDTSLKHRAQYYPKTAQRILDFYQSDFQPTIGFFPSYQYAETIKTYVHAIDPFTNILVQPRSVTLQEQAKFIQDAKLSANILFLILGSSFTESIDALGDSFNKAIVIGPALPEVNPIQSAKMKLYTNNPFHAIYQVPAITKINQALGRLVRKPEQSAHIILHCKRFLDPAYQQLLHKPYKDTINPCISTYTER